MKNIWGPDRGEFVRAEGSTPFDGPDGPAQTGRTLERPARLEEGDMVEAVSRRPQGNRGGRFTRCPPAIPHHLPSPHHQGGDRDQCSIVMNPCACPVGGQWRVAGRGTGRRVS